MIDEEPRRLAAAAALLLRGAGGPVVGLGRTPHKGDAYSVARQILTRSWE